MELTLFTNSSIHLFLIAILMRLLQIAKMEVSKAQSNYTAVVGSYCTLHSYLTCLRVNCLSKNEGKRNLDFFPLRLGNGKQKSHFHHFGFQSKPELLLLWRKYGKVFV